MAAASRRGAVDPALRIEGDTCIRRRPIGAPKAVQDSQGLRLHLRGYEDQQDRDADCRHRHPQIHRATSISGLL